MKPAIDPRMPTDPVQPAFAQQGGPVRSWALEVWDHLWPWDGADGAQSQHLWRWVAAVLALATTVAWAMAATGRLHSGAIIGWWFGWSLMEVAVRMASKPYVKEGPWWQRHYRVATLMDMVCYVGFKNLLIGAGLFLCLKYLGWMPMSVG